MPKATPEQIAEWKKQHGDVFEIEVDGKFGYLKKPDRKTISYATAVQNNPIKSDEVLMNNCWLGGDEEIKTNDDLFMSARPHLGQILELKSAEIRKL